MNDQEAHDYYADPEHLKIAGPARKHPKDMLTGCLSARISPSLLNQVTSAAAAEGISAGAWARRALRNELERSGWKAGERARRAAGAARPEGLIEGSGRRGGPRALPSSLSLRRRSFSCPHLSVGNVASVICGTCGPLESAATTGEVA